MILITAGGKALYSKINLKKELEILHENQILLPVGVDKMVKW